MLVTTGSITTAERLVRALDRSAGVRARVIHTPADIKKGGCSYAVRFDESDADMVRATVRQYGLPVRKYYRESISQGRYLYHAVS
ncbi:MAG: DUF3343 domain-containing protein [Clostridia bacterium]|nr:DUF3343 domain-containing protein [Clostridia bacterium]